MKTYTIYVHDVRDREPLRLAAELSNDGRAREFARERLHLSAYYSAVEVWDGPERLCCVKTGGAPEACAA